MSSVRYPDAWVRLSDMDGNALAVVATVQRELRTAGVTRAEVDAFRAAALAGDYEQLLATVEEWVNVL